MAQTVRVEFLKLGGGGQQVSPEHGAKALIGTPVVVPVTGTATAGVSRPQSPADTYVAVRLTAQGGAAYVAWGEDPTATDSNSVLMIPGAEPFVVTSVRGVKFSFLAANLDPLPVSVRDLTVAADTVNLNTSDLEAVISTTNTNLGARADTPASSDAGTFSLIALVKRLLQQWTTGVRLLAGEEHLGEVGGVTLVAKASPTTDTANYLANDALFSKQAMTVARIAAGSGRLTRIAVRSRTAVNVQMFLHIFDSDPTLSTLTRNSPIAIHTTDQPRILKTLSIPPSQWNSLRGQSPWFTAELLGISAEMTNLGFKLASGTDMFFVVETAGAHVPGTTSDINLIVESESN